MDTQLQFIRKATLILYSAEGGLDLSDFRITFDVQATDTESPNNAAIRVYNLSRETIDVITSKKEYSEVVLNAGYSSNFGVIFRGTIRQYRIGRVDAKTTYLDILAADWDIGYNQGFISTSLANPTQAEVAKAAAQAMIDADKQANPTSNKKLSESIAISDFSDKQNVPQLRGKVLFGMARAKLRDVATSLDASWSIQDGVIQIVPMRGYTDGEIVELNRMTGMIGIPDQTPGGLVVKCLLNPKIRVGNLIHLNNEEINTLLQADPNAGPIPFDSWAGFQHNTKLSPSGHYRVYTIESNGDTRGNDWYSTLVCLAVDMTIAAKESRVLEGT